MGIGNVDPPAGGGVNSTWDRSRSAPRPEPGSLWIIHRRLFTVTAPRGTVVFVIGTRAERERGYIMEYVNVLLDTRKDQIAEHIWRTGIRNGSITPVGSEHGRT